MVGGKTQRSSAKTHGLHRSQSPFWGIAKPLIRGRNQNTVFAYSFSCRDIERSCRLLPAPGLSACSTTCASACSICITAYARRLRMSTGFAGLCCGVASGTQGDGACRGGGLSDASGHSVLRVSPATHRQALSASLYLLYWSLINIKLLRLPAPGRSGSRAEQTKLPSGRWEAGSSQAARPYAFASLDRWPSSVRSPLAANAG